MSDLTPIQIGKRKNVTLSCPKELIPAIIELKGQFETMENQLDAGIDSKLLGKRFEIDKVSEYEDAIKAYFEKQNQQQLDQLQGQYDQLNVEIATLKEQKPNVIEKAKLASFLKTAMLGSKVLQCDAATLLEEDSLSLKKKILTEYYKKKGVTIQLDGKSEDYLDGSLSNIEIPSGNQLRDSQISQQQKYLQQVDGDIEKQLQTDRSTSLQKANQALDTYVDNITQPAGFWLPSASN